MADKGSPGASTAPARLPATIWTLGFVSLLMDVSSEMIHSLLPVFLATTMGASALLIGLIDGAAEATALMVKMASGALSDRLNRRKPLAVLGYTLGALSKPLFALAPGAGTVLAARLIDRVGKGIRGAPRDALVADLAPASMRGAAFGLRQALDTVGAFLGPLIAIGLMLLLANDIRAVFWVAVIPGVCAALLLAVGVREPQRPRQANPHPVLSHRTAAELGSAYWWVVAVGAAFTLARFSEAFLVLRATQGGLALAWTPLVLIVMNVVYAACAYPFGQWFDKVGSRPLLGAGLVALIAADLLLAAGDSPVFTWCGIALWGLHMALTQGVLAAMVAEAAPESLRGTAFGTYYLVSGLAMLVASALAGWLWDRCGAEHTFLAGAVFAGLALIGLGWRRAAPDTTAP